MKKEEFICHEDEKGFRLIFPQGINPRRFIEIIRRFEENSPAKA